MATELFRIYRLNGAQVEKHLISQFAQGFSGDLGVLDNVFRVDFLDPEGGIFCAFPCASGSSVNANESYVKFILFYEHHLGAPQNVSADKLCLTGQVEVINNAPTFVTGGALIDDVPVTGGSKSYADTLNRFIQPNADDAAEVQSSKNPTEITIFDPPWTGFDVGDKLYYRVRNVTFPGPSNPYTPVFTVERQISAQDAFGLRHLPPPFSISVARRVASTDLNKISLRVVQLPVEDWFLHPSGPVSQWWVDVAGFQSGTIADFWQHSVVDRYVGALQSVSNSEVLSLLPAFNPAVNLPAQIQPLSDSDWRLRMPVPALGQSISLQRLEPLDGPYTPSQSVALGFDGLYTHSGTGLVLTANLATRPLENVSVPYVSLQLAGILPVGDTKVRLGSIDLNLDPAPAPPRDAAATMSCDITFERVLSDLWIPRVSILGALPLQDVQPGGQDDPVEPQFQAWIEAAGPSAAQRSGNGQTPLPFQREPALLVSVPSSTTPSLLGIKESSQLGLSQQLVLTVSVQNASGGANSEILVIDRNPFTVALVQLPNLASTASAETNEIAIWSNTFPEGPGWRVSAGAGSFQLLLPPQGVGEAMVTGPNIAHEPAEATAVDFRLAPPAQASLSASNLSQRFAEPGWNLRRILGYPGEQSPGASLGSMQFEMLYGLTCNLATTGLRISEIFSRLGGFAGPLVSASTGQLDLSNPGVSSGTSFVEGYVTSQNDQMKQLNSDWSAAYRQLQSRLGVLDLWDQIDDFDISLSDGVSYQVRKSADSAAPNDTDINHKQLRGGLAYALNDPNLYQELMSSPQASSATLINPHFSALGGFGKQRAGFANDKIIIESEVFMGSLNTLTVTLIGRIGNLWHHAKHVTVYKRSVRPSRQFYLEQPRLEGRPVLRKVSEYVDIVQKTRSYPESGSALACGFLQGCEFKSLRINVDSSWGFDVGTIGWCVPLWRRDAQPSDVYPNPQVLLQMAIDPATGNPMAAGEIQNPEKLCFYTDTQTSTGSDTDLWPPVEWIDYVNAPPARSVSNTGLDFSAEPGYGKFTYSLAADASQINVVSQRTSKAMAVALRSTTFMRAQQNPVLPSDTNIQLNASKAYDFVSNVLSEVEAAGAAVASVAPHDSKQITDGITARLNRGDLQQHIGAPLQAALNNLKTGDPGNALCSHLADAAKSSFQALAATFDSAWSLLLSTARSELLALANTQGAALDSLKQQLLSEVNNGFVAAKSGAGILLADLSVIQTFIANIQTTCANVAGELTTLGSQITAASLQVSGPLYQATATRCRDDLNALFDDIQQSLNSATYLFGPQALTFDQLSDTRTALNAAVASVNNTFATMLTAFAAKDANAINAQIQALIGLLPPAPLQTALTTLATKLQAVTGASNTLLATLNTLRQTLIANINAVNPTTAADYVNAIAESFTAAQQAKFDDLAKQTADNLATQVGQSCTTLLQTLTGYAQSIPNLLDTQTLLANLGLTDADDFANAINNLKASYTGQLDSLVQSCTQIANLNNLAPQIGQTTGLSILRAFGAPPVVPSLNLTLPGSATNDIAYFFTELTPVLNQGVKTLTSNIVQAIPISDGVLSAVDQGYAALGDAQSQLKQLGITGLPTGAVLDRLVPDAEKLGLMDLSSLFPNIAGLSLDNLFSGISVPTVANDNIHISHQVDPQSLRASLDVIINFPIAQTETTLFSIGPVTVSVENCVFAAAVHVAGGAGQSVTRTSSGSITADWHVSIGGTEILVFVSTALTFDQSGHLHFDIQPSRVRLAAILQFLADFVQGIGLGGGFSLNLLPTGIQCILALPFPDMSFGAFGISNLALGCLFELQILPTFAITVGANLGAKKAPFALTIFILGGAGWFESSVAYTPGTGQLKADVSIGILASAILSISLGPVSGGVYIYFGITAEFHSAGGLDLGILILIQGRVSLLGIVDADITLMLQAEYTSGGGLIGRGEVDVSIKICWCFTLDVHQSVEYSFGSSSSSSQSSNAASSQDKALPKAAPPAPAPMPVPKPQQYANAATFRINFLT